MPNFEAGVLSEPLLIFGGHHHHIDPKTGLALYGPYTLADQSQPPISSVTVGLVGPSALLSAAKQWIESAQFPLYNDGRQPFLYPHFPGFNENFPFRCQLVTGNTWNEPISERHIDAALHEPSFPLKVSGIVKLYIDSIHNLSERQPKPQVVICIFSNSIIEACYSDDRHNRPRRPSALEKRELRKKEIGLQYLFDDMAAEVPNSSVASGYNNLRRALKAEAMAFGLPTQLLLENTIRSGDGGPRSQDIATKAWNFFTALYHKAGGHPWRLAESQPGTCYVGISFFKDRWSGFGMRTSLAQAFTHTGDGFVLRGKPFNWDFSKHSSPHLSASDARDLLLGVIDLFVRHRKVRPERIVVHKSSRYWPEELQGFKDALQGIPHWDLVALSKRKIQFLRSGNYPPLRGTWVRFSDEDFLLYTQGYVPYLRTYPGMRSPQPQEIIEKYGTSPPDTVLREILALTKLNWNSADFSCDEPITLAFSRRVGEILGETRADINPQRDYRFYM